MKRFRRNQIPKIRGGEAISKRLLNGLLETPFSILGGRGIKVSESNGRVTIALTEPIVNPRPSFFGTITAAPTADGDNRWTYEVSEAILTGSGYTGWTTRTGGRVVTARNISEVGNTSSVAGGIDQLGGDYPDGFDTVPVPQGHLVHVWQVLKADQSAIEWWFNWGPTAHDGTCDAP